jgi:hypothetical protein
VVYHKHGCKLQSKSHLIRSESVQPFVNGFPRSFDTFNLILFTNSHSVNKEIYNKVATTLILTSIYTKNNKRAEVYGTKKGGGYVFKHPIRLQ